MIPLDVLEAAIIRPVAPSITPEEPAVVPEKPVVTPEDPDVVVEGLLICPVETVIEAEKPLVRPAAEAYGRNIGILVIGILSAVLLVFAIKLIILFKREE
ncbi:MAG TPA: hypothetical protein ENK70_01940 [Methylophaga sp.]|nr:hypothetical protein [Methylophaga sp.]